MSVPLGTAHDALITKLTAIDENSINKTFVMGQDPTEDLATAQLNSAGKNFAIVGGVDNSSNSLQKLNPVKVSDDGHLSVAIQNSSIEQDTIMKARSNIADPNTETFLKCDSNGILSVKEVGTVNVAPANSVNSHITNDPANSYAVGLKARQTIATATTETFLKCTNLGELSVSLADKVAVNTGASVQETTADLLKPNFLVCGVDSVSSASQYNPAKIDSNGNAHNVIVNAVQIIPHSTIDGDGSPSASLNMKLQDQTKSIKQYASQSLAGSGAWATTIDTRGYGKISIVINSNATSSLFVYGCSTNGGTFLPFKSIIITSEDTGAGNHNVGFIEIQSPPDFLKIFNTDAGGVVLDIITTLSN